MTQLGGAPVPGELKSAVGPESLEEAEVGMGRTTVQGGNTGRRRSKCHSPQLGGFFLLEKNTKL